MKIFILESKDYEIYKDETRNIFILEKFIDNRLIKSIEFRNMREAWKALKKSK